MANKIPEVKVSKFSDFVREIENARKSLDTDDLWYRGISRTSHKLVPGLFRHADIKNIDDAILIEKKLYDEFSFRSPSYDGHNRDQWDMLFLMQHYRAPTRLLDWSSSPLIALFFAVSGALDGLEPASVWVMDPAKWNSGMLHDIGQEPSIFNTNDEMLDPYHPRTNSKTRRSQLLAVEGIINNPRINIQKGKFVIFGHQVKSMEDAAVECPVWGAGMPLLRILIEPSGVLNISKELWHYGITYTSVFPDLDGLAIELKLKNGFSNV